MSARMHDERQFARFRVPPQSIEAEQAVLGGLMLAPDAYDRVANLLVDGDFYRRDHQLIYRAIRELAEKNRPYDAVTLGEWFESMGQAELVAGGAYLIELASTTPSAANIAAYAEIVREKSLLRQAIEHATNLVNACFQPEGEEPAAILDHAIRDLMALTKAQARHDYTLQQATRLAWEDAHEAWQHRGVIRGVPTGFARMDKRLGGWHRGDLVILGARPSMGKTALMVNLVLNCAGAGHAAGMISGEQSALQIGQRSVAAEARVPAERLRNGDFEEEDWPKLSGAVRRLVERKVCLYDRSAPTLEEVCRLARKWKQEEGIAILFVDYLQRIRVPRAENRVAEVAEVSRGLKTLARDLDMPVVALAQVKAEVDNRAGDKRPNLGDVANSDEATREADLIGFLYRDEVYRDDSPDRGMAELNFEKNRHGPIGRFWLRFDAATMLFSELEK